MKIAIIGYSGSGKSTLAKNLGALYHIPVLYLDTVHFISNWQEREKTEALEMVEAFMEKPSWIIDGNYSHLNYNKRLEEADKIIFMNFPRRTCIKQAFKRYRENKGKSRESMADGCNEKLDYAFIKWILLDSRTKKYQQNYARILETYPDKTIVFKKCRQVDEFIINQKT